MGFTTKLTDLLAAVGASTAVDTASQQQQSLGQAANGNASSFTQNQHTHTLGGTSAGGSTFSHLSATQLGSLLSGYGTPMTPEEKVELEELKKEHEFKLKLAKLDVFKQLPADIRQLVINAHMWQACCNNMNSTTIAKDPKLEELERKSDAGKIYMSSGAGQWSTGYASGSSLFGNFIATNLPTGVTVDDLKQAHMEATLEEEVLNGEVND